MNKPSRTHPEDYSLNPAFIFQQNPDFEDFEFSLILDSIRKYMIEVNCWKSCRQWLLDELNGDEKAANERFADPCECKKPLDHYGDNCDSATWFLRMITGAFYNEDGPNNPRGLSLLEPGDTRYIAMLQAKNISFSNFFIEMRRYMVAAGGWKECQDAIAHLNETEKKELSKKDCSCRLLAPGKESRFRYNLYLLGATMCYRV
ncbi:unnamed protein product, partial [Mesorhabditis belari]|uniref:Uncharacterized protein n=1 Tax=Mesorhabditis belari TaxID=2138241 RepID=A0AAF3F7U5_9BILA